MSRKRKDLVRIDIRLTREKNENFEKVVRLGSYGNMTAFIITTLEEKADQIIKDNERIIASEKDARIFFEAITHPPQRNRALKADREEYRSLIVENHSDEN